MYDDEVVGTISKEEISQTDYDVSMEEADEQVVAAQLKLSKASIKIVVRINYLVDGRIINIYNMCS